MSTRFPQPNIPPVPHSCRIAVIVARFNSEITEKLLKGAKNAFMEHGVSENQIEVYYVPGSAEIPLAASASAQTGKFCAIVCLGAVIKGETDHYEHISRVAADGIRDVNLKYGIPVTFGVLTCDTVDKARERCGPDKRNVGRMAAEAALGMIFVIDSIKELSPDTTTAQNPSILTRTDISQQSH